MSPPRWTSLLMALALGPGCEGPWRAEDALRPGLERLDADGDGRLSAEELGRGSPSPTDITDADSDGDGALDLGELLALVRARDPASFDEVEPGVSPTPEDGQRLRSDPPPVRRLRVLYEFMVAEVRRLRPDHPLPSPEAIRAAAGTGRLDSPESQAVLVELTAAYRELGFLVPPPLQATSPAPPEPG